MKKCSFCSAELAHDVMRCSVCGGMLDKSLDWQKMQLDQFSPKKKSDTKWYFKTSAVVTAFLMAGPLALPLVWFHPEYSVATKVTVTVIVVAATFYLGAMLLNSLKTIACYYQQIGF
jgi:hypothetical protein